MRKPSNSRGDGAILLKNRFPIMISACLLGINCRYDGEHSACSDLVEFMASVPFVPFCPEQLGGLSTPRPPSTMKSGDGRDVLSGKAQLINAAGENVTDAFIKGAEEAYVLARLSRAPLAIMKDKSPSCGLKTPYCEKTTDPGIGVCAALFISRGVRVFELGREDTFSSQELLGLL